ncbi:MAG: DUF1028 domain-containing protein [Anaerolineales bacterium]|jgi:uncharacterized Ntn-hydrolase superfamily protein
MANVRAGIYLDTFSIVALDPGLGEVGLAVASRAFDSGYYVAFLKAGVGGVASQASVNARLGGWILDALEAGATPAKALESALARDEGAPQRQVGVVDFQGRTAAHTGSENGEWAGHITSGNVSVQGNLLAGPAVIEAMFETYQSASGTLAERLMLALEAGEKAGGDKRGKQSAALIVRRKRGGFGGVDDRLVDLRITDHSDPLPELRRLFSLWKYQVMLPSYVRLAEEEPEQAHRLHRHLHGFMQAALPDTFDDANLYNNLAWFMAERKLFPAEALQAAQRAAALAPDDSNVLDTLAEAHFAAGDISQAIHWINRALELVPDSDYLKGQLERFQTQE